MFTLAISCQTGEFALIHEPNITGSYEILFFSIGLYFHHQLYPQLGVVFALAPSLHSFWVISPLIFSSILGTY